MRIERLNDNKIKVTLTTSDLTDLDIDMKRLTPDSRELHAFLFHIMETIREETGFNPYSGQVIVEASPTGEGMSIIISRLNRSVKRVTRSRFKNASGVKAVLKNPDETEIFYFEAFRDLCSALKETENSSLGSGSLYRLGTTYCFTIKSDMSNRHCINIMSEFSASRSKYPMQITYIKEHGVLVAKGKKLIEMTEKIRQLT